MKKAVAAAALALLGCGGDDAPPPASPPPVRPDHVVNEQKTHTSTHEDTGFSAEAVTLFRTPDVLPDLDVRALALVGANVYAGTASGLARRGAAGAAFDAVPLAGAGAVVDLAILDGDRLVVARADEIQVLAPDGAPGDVWAAAGAAIAAVATLSGAVYVGTPGGIATVDAAGVTPIAAAQGFAARDLAAAAGVLWIATGAGVLRYDPVANAMLPALTAPEWVPDDDVRALAASGPAVVLAATANGFSRIEAGIAAALTRAGEGGLPNGDLRAVAEAAGEVLTGHGIGATVSTPGSADHYHTERWLPAEQVTAVALAPDRTRWIATPAGISRIAFEPSTLGAKASFFEALVARHDRMDGFVADTATLDDPWAPDAPLSKHDHDNDGLWTEMQIAAWCFAYAATGDEQYYQSARKAMDVMQLLFDVPGETFGAAGMPRGFITRSLVRDDEGPVFEEKRTQANWHEQAFGGRTYFWKDDTSSDEYAGHFFGIPIYYDLCAKTDDEREAIRTRVHSAMSYIVDNGYVLIDLDGEGTKHGHWNNLATAVDGLPECLAAGKPNCPASYGGEGWLNSIEILGHLLAAWHITGDDRFYDEYQRLAVDERYGEMIPFHDETFTVTSHKNRNHSDHELASLAYFTLLRYEPNTDRRDVWLDSLRRFYEFERPERNTLEIGVMASAMPDGFELLDAAQTFQEWPLDTREWLYDNSHRVDAALDGVDRFDNPQFAVVFPYDEIRTMKWNGNPYAVSGGGDGREVQAPWPYLLPYWMMRYYGVITGQ